MNPMTRRRFSILLGGLPAMAQRSDLMHLPADLPVPLDDGACDHLSGMIIPNIALKSTSGRMVDLGKVATDRAIVYAYPRTGTPDKAVPSGWDAIPGARGCTPQSCSMR